MFAVGRVGLYAQPGFLFEKNSDEGSQFILEIWAEHRVLTNLEQDHPLNR
jgi:hypothetical protein